MQKRSLISLSIVFVLLFTLGSSIAMADSPGNGSAWITGFFLTNKTSTVANVTMNFYKTGTDVAAYTPSDTVAANDTVFYFLGDTTAGSVGATVVDSGEYSLVVSSDQAVNAVANSTSSGGAAGTGATNSTTAFDGISGDDAASTLYAPNIYSNYFGFTTNFYLQNAGSALTTVAIAYFDDAGAQITALNENVDIPAGSFITRDQLSVTDLTTNTVGSATFSCGETGCALAGVVNIINGNSTTNGIGTANYVMYGAGSQVAYAPVVLNGYYFFNSSINLQNNGTGTINVDIVFSDGTTVNVTNLAPGQAFSSYLPGVTGLASGDTNGALAATVSILSPAAGNSIVVLVNTSTSTDKSFASYNGVAGGSQVVYAPASNALAYNGLDFFTSITCQNLGTITTNLQYDFSGVNTKNSDAAVSSAGAMSDITFGTPVSSLAQGESYVLLLNQVQIQGDLGIPNGFNGSTKITALASGASIACVVNQNRATPNLPGDNLGAYTTRP